MEQTDYELRLKNVRVKLGTLNSVRQNWKEQFFNATTLEAKKVFKNLIIGNNESYEDCKREYLTLIANPNQNN